ncbi:MAG: hypothetical protein IJ268_04640 [Proteobacteria bacterium]|nr:hypothetical protein [Pseudomonadota bacterium]
MAFIMRATACGLLPAAFYFISTGVEHRFFYASGADGFARLWRKLEQSDMLDWYL